MNDLMTKWFGTSWRTTLGGLLIGIPPIVSSALVTANIPIGKWIAFADALSMGMGGLILGINSKDRQVHSTLAQVEQATTGTMPQATQATTVQAIQPLPQGGVALTSATTVATKPPEAPPAPGAKP